MQWPLRTARTCMGYSSTARCDVTGVKSQPKWLHDIQQRCRHREAQNNPVEHDREEPKAQGLRVGRHPYSCSTAGSKRLDLLGNHGESFPAFLLNSRPVRPATSQFALHFFPIHQLPERGEAPGHPDENDTQALDLDSPEISSISFWPLCD